MVSCAGSGKTTRIVEESLKLADRKILITTYTHENLDQITSMFIEKNGCVPENVTIMSWFSFLLQHCVRPYQNLKTEKSRTTSIYWFPNGNDGKAHRASIRNISENKDGHYFTSSSYIYEDKVSKFAFMTNKSSNGAIVKRLEHIFNDIMIDEAQDLEGWDYDFIGALIQSNLNVLLVGDPRQKILKTHRHNKNKPFSTVFDWLNKQPSPNFQAMNLNRSFRCHQSICDFSDELFPDREIYPKTESGNDLNTKHDGIFIIPEKDVHAYVYSYQPKILRYDKRANTSNLQAINIGQVKGRTYERILIFPTDKWVKYLKTKNLSDAGNKYRLYVAVTRARQSVAFVVPDNFEQQQLCLF